MIAHKEHRTTLISLKTGKTIKIQPSRGTLKDSAAARKRYGILEKILLHKNPQNLKEVAENAFSMARTMFLKDGYHVPIALLLNGHQWVQVFQIELENRAAKYMMMRELANEVERQGADGVILINEIWIGEFDQDQPFVYPSERPDREEALAVLATNSAGEIVEMLSKIKRRRFRKPALEECTDGGELVRADILAPIQAVWRKRKT
jgi:hypothetical protein